MAREKNPDNKVGLLRLLLWNSSSVSVAINVLLIGYVNVYASNALGVPIALVGTLLLVSKLIDSVTDLVAGFIVDRTQTRWGKGRPYEIFMVFLWISTWVMFSCPEGLSMVAKCVWIVLANIFVNAVCRTFVSANNLVYMVRAFKTKAQQTKLMAYGSFFTMGAGFLFNIFFPIGMATIATDAAGWSRLVGMFVLPLTAIGLLRMLTIKEQYNNEVDVTSEKLKLKDVITLFKGNRYLRYVFSARFLYNIVLALGVGVYFWQFVVGNLALMGATAVLNIVGLPMAFFLPVMMRKLGLKKMCIYGFIVSAVGYTLLFFAGTSIPVIMVMLLLQNLGTVPFNMMFGMYTVECADYNEAVGIQRMEGTIGALYGLSDKIGSAFGGFIGGVLLQIAGYDGTLAVQPDSALLMIRVCMSFIPAIGVVLMILLIRKYTLADDLKKIKEQKLEACETK